MTYNLHEIMCKAWKLFRKGIGTFAECLHRAWNSAKAEPINAQRIAEARQSAGVTEQVNTWAGYTFIARPRKPVSHAFAQASHAARSEAHAMPSHLAVSLGAYPQKWGHLHRWVHPKAD